MKFLIIETSHTFAKLERSPSLDELIKYQVKFRPKQTLTWSEDLKSEIRKALNKWNGEEPKNKVFQLAGITEEDNWKILSMTTADLDNENDEKEITPKNTFNILVLKHNNKWIASIDTDPLALELLKEIPENKLSSSTKKLLFSQNSHAISTQSTEQQYWGYKFPWPPDKPWQATNSYSDNNPPFWHQGNGLDFDVKYPETNSDVLSAADGNIIWQCGNLSTDNSYFIIKTAGTNENIAYVHISMQSLQESGIYTGQPKWIYKVGDFVRQGQKLGVMLNTDGRTVADDCGGSQGTHLHLGFPTRPFTIDGRTFDSYTVPPPSVPLFSTQTQGCVPPVFGDWIIQNSICTITDHRICNGSIIVKSGGVLNIESNAAVELDFINKFLKVEDGGKVLINNNGKLN